MDRILTNEETYAALVNDDGDIVEHEYPGAMGSRLSCISVEGVKVAQDAKTLRAVSEWIEDCNIHVLNNSTYYGVGLVPKCWVDALRAGRLPWGE